VASIADAPPEAGIRKPPAIWTAIRRNPTIFIGAVVLASLALMAILAPLIAGDPVELARRPLPRIDLKPALLNLGLQLDRITAFRQRRVT
jgi:hypothetical protein